MKQERKKMSQNRRCLVQKRCKDRITSIRILGNMAFKNLDEKRIGGVSDRKTEKVTLRRNPGEILKEISSINSPFESKSNYDCIQKEVDDYISKIIKLAQDIRKTLKRIGDFKIKKVLNDIIETAEYHNSATCDQFKDVTNHQL